VASRAGYFEDERDMAREERRFRGPLFVLTILVGSFLLFLVQPMIARMALPRLGGAPAVWNSAMLVYQALLLAGYAYAHAIGRLAVRQQAMVHVGLLLLAALFWLPIGLIDATPSSGVAPTLWVPWLLVLSIGPLFFVVAAQAPLVQRWYNAASGGRDPYALYAASNLGSFGGLIAYPLLVEPRLPLMSQSQLWTAGYLLLIALVVGCALMLPRRQATGAAAPVAVTERPGWRRQLYWVVLAFVPSGLMLSTTTHLTTDIVAMPLLWVLPLGIYLLSFSVAFAARRGVTDVIAQLSPLVILVLGGLTIRVLPDQPYFSALCGLALLFVVGVTLHGEMYRTRPAPERLTGFYLCMALGGVLGGVFAALIAPTIFDWTYEHPLLILAAGALVPQTYLFPFIRRLWRDPVMVHFLTAIVVLLVVIIAVLAIDRPWQWLWEDGPAIGALAIGFVTLFTIGKRIPYLIGLAGVVLVFGGWDSLKLSMDGDARTRSYFGVYTIRDYPYEGVRTLAHGTTSHGLQIMQPGRQTEPTSYYAPASGIGQALIALPDIMGDGARVGIVGLGTGTLACYAKPDQHWVFYEIDRTVIRLARDPSKFSYLASCLPRVPVVLGDARLSLAAAAPGSLDLLALDAFSSDAVPIHLLTREAFDTYGRALGERGLLVVHISNRFLDLEPVIAAAAARGGWTAALLHDVVADDAYDSAFRSSSVWVAMSRDPATVGKLINRDSIVAGGWRPLMPRAGFTQWTDDFASILPLVIALQPDDKPTQEQ
jgi:SAM-dependent methyltransferase